jgi:hypothetical protein
MMLLILSACKNELELDFTCGFKDKNMMYKSKSMVTRYKYDIKNSKVIVSSNDAGFVEDEDSSSVDIDFSYDEHGLLMAYAVYLDHSLLSKKQWAKDSIVCQKESTKVILDETIINFKCENNSDNGSVDVNFSTKRGIVEWGFDCQECEVDYLISQNGLGRPCDLQNI